MTPVKTQQRREERKFKRIFVRYGNPSPQHKAVATHISSGGLFLSTNNVVYRKDSPIAVEIVGQAGTWVVPGIVRHASKVPPNMAAYAKPGMGVEFMQPPAECRCYLAAL